jgi:hypothetical protein
VKQKDSSWLRNLRISAAINCVARSAMIAHKCCDSLVLIHLGEAPAFFNRRWETVLINCCEKRPEVYWIFID